MHFLKNAAIVIKWDLPVHLRSWRLKQLLVIKIQSLESYCASMQRTRQNVARRLCFTNLNSIVILCLIYLSVKLANI